MQIRCATQHDLPELMAFYTRMNEVINSRTDVYNPDNPVFSSPEMVREAIDSEQQFIGIEDIGYPKRFMLFEKLV